MRRVLVKAILALAALASPQLAARVEACSCLAIPTPYKSFADARAVFTGRVTGSADVPFKEKVRDKTYT